MVDWWVAWFLAGIEAGVAVSGGDVVFSVCRQDLLRSSFFMDAVHPVFSGNKVYFQFHCHLRRRVPSSRVELVVFSSVQTMVRLTMF